MYESESKSSYVRLFYITWDDFMDGVGLYYSYVYYAMCMYERKLIAPTICTEGLPLLFTFNDLIFF